MTGRLYDPMHRNNPKKSIAAFQKAIKFDPNATEVYKILVPLEFEATQFDKNMLELAIKHASKAIELDPENYEILTLLAQQAAITGQLPEAIKLLEQASKSTRIEKETPQSVELNKNLGLLYMLTGQKESAADCYEVLFDAVKSPHKYGLENEFKASVLANTATNFERMGQVFMDANRLKLALEAFELSAKGARLGSGNLTFNRAKILYLQEKYDEALTELQSYFDAQRITKGREPYQLLADILAKQNKSDELIGRLEKIAEDDSQNSALQMFLADQLSEVGELERARKIYDTVLQTGGDTNGYAGLAKILRKMQKSDELLDALGRGLSRADDAVAALEAELQALSKDKDLVSKLLESGRTRAKANKLSYEQAYILAKLAAALKEPEASGEFYRLAIQNYRNPAKPLEVVKINIQIEMADMYTRLKRYKLAVDVLKEILASRMLSAEGERRINTSLAQALAHDNRIDEALQTIGIAINLDDDNARLRFIEASIYMQARRWDEAIRKLEELLNDDEFKKDNQIVLLGQFSLSNVYVQKGELRKGEEILERIIETDPESSQANNDLGYLWADQGKNLDRAEEMIRKALKAEPENPAYLDSLGWVLFKLGKLEDAVPPLEQATQRDMSNDSTVWDHLGDVFLRLAKVDKAIESWQTALQHSEEEGSPDPDLVERGAKPVARPAEKEAP
jgi:tetratricopeptide (TPR) repeat protein